MILCDFCKENLAPRSRQQLRIRQENITRSPQVAVAPCPVCNGTDWALSEVNLVPIPKTDDPR